MTPTPMPSCGPPPDRPARRGACPLAPRRRRASRRPREPAHLAECPPAPRAPRSVPRPACPASRRRRARARPAPARHAGARGPADPRAAAVVAAALRRRHQRQDDHRDDDDEEDTREDARRALAGRRDRALDVDVEDRVRLGRPADPRRQLGRDQPRRVHRAVGSPVRAVGEGEHAVREPAELVAAHQHRPVLAVDAVPARRQIDVVAAARSACSAAWTISAETCWPSAADCAGSLSPT